MSHKVRFSFEGEEGFEIDCGEHEDVVTAALRQGYILLTECREGVCATCKGYLEDGDYDELLPHTPDALSPSDEEEGYILACRLQPRSDLLIDFDYPFKRVERFDERLRRGQIVALDRLAETVTRVVVRTLAAHGPLDYEPGQFMRLTLVGPGITRDFSMANRAGEDRLLEFLVKLLPGGEFSGHLANKAKVGDLVDVEGPFGSFTLHDSERPPVFVAGSTGLAPIAAMLRQIAAETPDRPCVLVFGCTKPADLFYRDELDKLAAELPQLKMHVTLASPDPDWQGETGFVTDVLDRALADHPGYEYYLCGPPAMVEAARRLLGERGVDRHQIHQENFIPSGR